MSAPVPLAILTPRQLIDEIPPDVIVDGMAWAGCLSVLVSESGAGKTFVLLDLASAITDGVAWHGRRTQQGGVLYCSFEGDALGLRLRALSEGTGRRLDDLLLIRGREPLSPLTSADGHETASVGERRLTEALASLAERDLASPIRLLVIDTVRASLNGSEDSSEQVAAYLRAIRRLMLAVPSAAAILAHHAGWQDGEHQKKRERGSSAWRGNCDATLYLEAGTYNPNTGTAPLTLTTLKVRDGERPAPLHLIRTRVPLRVTDRDGVPLTSCVITRDDRSREDMAADEAAAAARAHAVIDLKLLRICFLQPQAATSQERLRAAVAIGKQAMLDALARVLAAGWLDYPEKQRQPYLLTAAGRAALNGSGPH